MSLRNTTVENWVYDDSSSEWQKRAKKLSKEHDKYEKKLLKEGKKQILIPHPTSPRCFIVKFV